MLLLVATGAKFPYGGRHPGASITTALLDWRLKTAEKEAMGIGAELDQFSYPTAVRSGSLDADATTKL